MNAKDLTHRLNGKWYGSYGLAPCPAHDDAHPSLSLADDADGTILWNCKAGCRQEHVYAEVKRLGYGDAVKPKRASQSKKEETGPDQQKRLRECLDVIAFARGHGTTDTVEKYLQHRGIPDLPDGVLEYPAKLADREGHRLSSRFPSMICTVTDARSGTLLGLNITALEADGSDRRRRRQGKHNLGPVSGGVVHIPGERDDLVAVAEGVETAMSVKAITGLTTYAGLSANHLPKVNLPDSATEVIVCADNDEAGLSAARQLAARLAGEGKRVRLATPEGEGRDFNDVLLDPAADLEDVRAQILNAEHVEAERASAGLQLMRASEFVVHQLPPQKSLLRPWLHEQSLALIFAARGVGKTYFALGLAFAVASGKEFLGWTADEPRTVAYFDGEMSAFSFKARIEQFKEYFDGSPDNLWILNEATLKDGTMPMLDTEDGQQRISAALDELDPALVILDNISALTRAADENEAKAWKPINHFLLEQRRKHRAVVVIHHTNKRGDQRGTISKEDSLDISMQLSRPEGYTAEDGAIFEVSFTKNRGFAGEDARPFLARMSIKDGKMHWDRDRIENTRLSQLVEGLKAGKRQNQIAKEMNLHPSRITQLKNKAKEQGLLDE